MLDLNLSPAQLRRIADILETNSDQPGFDFYSALAAMEAEDTDADNDASVIAAATLSPAALVDSANEAVALSDDATS